MTFKFLKPKIGMYKSKIKFAPSKNRNDRIRSLSKKIPLLDVYGKNEQYGQYKEKSLMSSLFELYKLCTDEKDILIQFLNSRFDYRKYAKLKTNGIVDIGAGDGTMLYKICRHFKHVYIMDEVSDLDLSFFKNNTISNVLGVRKNLSFIVGRFPEEPLPIGIYDTVLNSHMHYHSKREEWSALSNASFDLLREGGELITVLHGDEGHVNDMVRYFDGRYDYIDNFYSRLIDDKRHEAISIKINYITSHHARDLDTATHLAGFFLWDTGVDISKNDLQKYCKENFRVDDDHYMIQKVDKVLILQKSSSRSDSECGFVFSLL